MKIFVDSGQPSHGSPRVSYTYDSLNRLASAVTSDNPSVTQWGQSYAYDLFGNLTGQTVIKGSAPALTVAYDGNNHLWGGCTDANGNLLNQASCANPNPNVFDIENRLVQAGGTTVAYGYDPGNHRIWRGNSSTSLDEIAFWGVDGKKLATYSVGVASGGGSLVFGVPSLDVYFGGKLVSKGAWNSSYSFWQLTPVTADRLGSIGKFYPYGQEKPSATTNDTEKFTGYFRDASTGLDYAVNRYEQPGIGRFLTPDPSWGSAAAGDPGTWNRYAYVSGDPINRRDSLGLCDDVIGGITQSSLSSDSSLGLDDYASEIGAIQAFPYADLDFYASLPQVWHAAMSSGATLAKEVVLSSLVAAGQDPGPVNVVAYSGGSAAFTAAIATLQQERPDIYDRIQSVTYISPGSPSEIATGSWATNVVLGTGFLDPLATLGTQMPPGTNIISANCLHGQTACLLRAAAPALSSMTQNSCSVGGTFSANAVIDSHFNYPTAVLQNMRTAFDVLSFYFGTHYYSDQLISHVFSKITYDTGDGN